MSILIKGKALPKTCEECLFYGIDAESGCFLEKCYVIRRAGQGKPSWCPLVPVPSHGRLIDADALCDGLVSNHPVAIYAKTAPTIIEAEKQRRNRNENNV